MTDQPEMTRFSQWLSSLLTDQPAPDFTLEPWQHATVESFQQAITERRLVHPTAPIHRPKSVTVRFTLRRTPLPTPPVTESVSRALRYMRLTAPATLARVYSLTRELPPLFSLESIETTPGYDYWVM